MTQQVNIRLSEEDYQTIAQIAKEQDRKPSYIVKQAVVEMLKTKNDGA